VSENFLSLSTLPPLREIIQTHGLRAEKKLGQNFLLDLNLTSKIARSGGELDDAIVFEIGPGPGGLTRGLLMAGAKKVIAIEYDARAIEALQSLKEAAKGRLIVIHDDALNCSLPAIGQSLGFSQPYKIIANLPYNIASPLLIRWLKEIRSDALLYQDMTLMFQKEVAQRLSAPVGGKTYGRLSVITQWLCGVRPVFDLPPEAFVPAPKVISSVVRLTPRAVLEGLPKFETMESLTAQAFGQRRKMIRGSLKEFMPLIEKLGIEPTLRAEDVSVEEYVRLACAIDSAKP
jgi:16S rRNA (adenine1518-N6/adenine1519-N6)-dimethyltransferase